MTSELAREIAELRGWTDIYTGPSGYTYARPPESGLMTEVPEPDTDPAACMELLQHMLTLRGVSRGEAMHDIGAVSFRIYSDAAPLVEWSVWRGPNAFTDNISLLVAITLACRDALKAIASAQDTTTPRGAD